MCPLPTTVNKKEKKYFVVLKKKIELKKYFKFFVEEIIKYFLNVINITIILGKNKFI